MAEPFKRRIIGIQVHNSVALDDATRGGANMCAGLSSAIRSTGDPELVALLDEAKALVRRIGAQRNAARERLQGFHDHPDFRRMRDGALPWPDETVGGFVPRCTCYDRCQIHDGGRSAAEGWECQCDPCPAHSA